VRSVGLVLLWPLLLAAVGCGENPVLGEWVVDPAQNSRGVLRATEAADLERLTFSRDAIESGDTRILVSYVVEDRRVRVVRGDGRGEHRVELLDDGRLHVELPIGVDAVYRRAGEG